jgi:hypothetical protein
MTDIVAVDYVDFSIEFSSFLVRKNFKNFILALIGSFQECSAKQPFRARKTEKKISC